MTTRLTSPDLQGTLTPLSIFFERTTNRVDRVLLRLGRVVTRGLLCRDFHMRVGRHKIVGKGHALDDFDALAGQRIVLHIAHRNEAVDSFQADPVHPIRHQVLESGVLPAGDTFSSLEILGRGIAAFLTLACVIDKKFRDFAERAAFLAIVDDDAESASLPGARAFLYAVEQVRTAGADVGTKYVRAVALVMHAASY